MRSRRAFGRRNPPAPAPASGDGAGAQESRSAPPTPATSQSPPPPTASPEPEPTPTPPPEPTAPSEPPPPPPEPAGNHEEPRFRGPLESAFRHKALTVVPILAALGLALAIGLIREPNYEAEAKISVGRVDAPVYTLDEVLIANATLARGYARLTDAQAVIRQASRAAGMSEDEARDKLSGSPLPGSSLITVEAEGDSERQAITLANAAAAGLIAYVERLNLGQQRNSLLARFRRAAKQYDIAQRRLQRVRRNRNASEQARAQARLEFFTQEARAEAARVQYRNSQGGLPPEGLLQLALPAADAESDRASVLQRLLLIGLGAGIVIGLGLALLRENRDLLSRPVA